MDVSQCQDEMSRTSEESPKYVERTFDESQAAPSVWTVVWQTGDDLVICNTKQSNSMNVGLIGTTELSFTKYYNE